MFDTAAGCDKIEGFYLASLILKFLSVCKKLKKFSIDKDRSIQGL